MSKLSYLVLILASAILLLALLSAAKNRHVVCRYIIDFEDTFVLGELVGKQEAVLFRMLKTIGRHEIEPSSWNVVSLVTDEGEKGLDEFPNGRWSAAHFKATSTCGGSTQSVYWMVDSEGTILQVRIKELLTRSYFK